MKNKYRHRTAHLCEALGVKRLTLLHWEKRGIFVPPRSGTRGDRRFTTEQINQIVKAFSPGGKGKWFFTPKTTDAEANT